MIASVMIGFAVLMFFFLVAAALLMRSDEKVVQTISVLSLAIAVILALSISVVATSVAERGSCDEKVNSSSQRYTYDNGVLNESNISHSYAEKCAYSGLLLGTASNVYVILLWSSLFTGGVVIFLLWKYIVKGFLMRKGVVR